MLNKRRHFGVWLVVALFSCQGETGALIVEQPSDVQTPEGMVWIPGRHFVQGAHDSDTLALAHERPAHEVAVDGFFMDATEVTNGAFRKFVAETGYITTAEKPVDWEAMKQTLPEGTPKPPDSLLRAGSLTFNRKAKVTGNLDDYSQWWEWVPKADWRHPQGPGSNIDGKDNYPVVHLSYEDMQTYCKWANRRLPTEAEWELAATGNQEHSIYTWGNDASVISKNANTWQGKFPTLNTAEDGYTFLAPVKSYPPNSLGLYDMAGNVWEVTGDGYSTEYYKHLKDKGDIPRNPQGDHLHSPSISIVNEQKVIKGGSFLCHASYCASFRISARMGMEPGSASGHIGFRTVATPQMIRKEYNRR